MKFKNIKIRNKLLTGFSGILLVAMAIGYIGYVGMHSIEKQQDEISNVRLPSIEALLIIDEAQTAIHSGECELLAGNISSELIKATYDRMDAAKERADKAWQIYEKLPQTDEEAGVWKEFVPAWNDWWKYHEHVMELAKRHSVNNNAQTYSALSNAVLVDSDAPHKKAEKLISELIRINREVADNANLNAEKVSDYAVLSLYIALILGVVISIVLGTIITRSITTPLNQSVKLADAVSMGDLTFRVDIAQDDEVGQLSKALEIMVSNLKEITTEIKTGVTVLGTSSSEILSTVTEISTGAAETATSVSETTTTVEEVRQTAMVSNQKAQSLMMSSQKAADSVEKGRESIHEVIQSMKKIENQMNLISNTVLKLAEQNRTIGEITSSVADIADQSNLLAVNAAIEAAKAGEHGRGFTVVAQEIRSLADQSKKATAQVKEILNEINKSVNQAVGVTEQGSRTVEEGRKLVALSGEVIELLADNVEETAEASIQISSSNQQQMAGMEQIVPAMENIKLASQQNVTGIKQAQAAAHDLNTLGQNLKDIIGKFKI